MDVKRRDFLKTALAGGSSAAFGPLTGKTKVFAEERAPKNEFSDDPTALRKLTDRVSLTRIGFGTGVCSTNRQSDLTRMGEEKAIALLQYAYDCGVRYFDLADSYGSHQLIRKAMAGKPRDSYGIVSKVWGHPQGGIPEPERLLPEELFPRFAEELGTDYIDVLQIHCMQTPDWISQFEKYRDSLEKLKEQGKIGAHGVSCHSFQASQVAAEDPWTDVIHFRMNTEDARMEGTLAENQATARIAHQNGKGTIIMKVIGEGSIQDPEKRYNSVRMVTQFDAADVMVVGFTKREEIDEMIVNVQKALNEQKEAAKA